MVSSGGDSCKPSLGEQIRLAFGDQEAVVTEVGAGLAYSAAGGGILDGYGRIELAPSGRGQLLIPWPNRIRDGAYELDGRSHQLDLNEIERQNAIHGLVRWSAWTVSEKEPERVVLEHVLRPRPGYPFTLELRVEYSLSEGGLAVALTALNTGSETCPYGAGAHPYLAVASGRVDDAVLNVPAASVLEADERGIQSGQGPSRAASWTSANRGRSAAPSSTTASRTSTGARTGWRAWRSARRRCGPTRATRT